MEVQERKPSSEILIRGFLWRKVGTKVSRRWRRELLVLQTTGNYYDLSSVTHDSFSKLFASCRVNFLTNWSKLNFKDRLVFHVQLIGEYAADQSHFVREDSCLLWTENFTNSNNIPSLNNATATAAARHAVNSNGAAFDEHDEDVPMASGFSYSSHRHHHHHQQQHRHGNTRSVVVKLRADSLADMVAWLDALRPAIINSGGGGDKSANGIVSTTTGLGGGGIEPLNGSLSWVGRWDEIYPCMLDVQYQRTISRQTSSDNRATTPAALPPPPSYDDVVRQIPTTATRRYRRTSSSSNNKRKSSSAIERPHLVGFMPIVNETTTNDSNVNETTSTLCFREHMPLPTPILPPSPDSTITSTTAAANNTTATTLVANGGVGEGGGGQESSDVLQASSWIRRDRDDTFLPPYGPAILWPVVMGQGEELGLPSSIQQLWDPNKNRLLYLDHEAKCVYLDLPPGLCTDAQSRRNRRISTSSMFSSGLDTINSPSFDKDNKGHVVNSNNNTIQSQTRHNRRSRKLSESRTSECSEVPGITVTQPDDDRWVTNCLRRYSRSISVSTTGGGGGGTSVATNGSHVDFKQSLSVGGELTMDQIQRKLSNATASGGGSAIVAASDKDLRSRGGGNRSRLASSSHSSFPHHHHSHHQHSKPLIVTYRHDDVIPDKYFRRLDFYRLAFEEAKRQSELVLTKEIILWLDASGPDGKFGVNGRDGRDGSHGAHGKHAQGYSGDGEDGRAGGSGERGSDGTHGEPGGHGRHVIVTLDYQNDDHSVALVYFGSFQQEVGSQTESDEIDSDHDSAMMVKSINLMERLPGYPIPIRNGHGLLLVNARGGNGGNGGDAGKGGSGGSGGHGGHGARGMADTDGGQGGQGGCGGSGGHGGNGGNAGSGGDGGVVIIRARDPALFALIEFDVCGGKSGKPGAAGRGGEGGPGGQGGSGGRPGDCSAATAAALINRETLLSVGGGRYDTAFAMNNLGQFQYTSALANDQLMLAAMNNNRPGLGLTAGHNIQGGLLGHNGRMGISGQDGRPGDEADHIGGLPGAVLWQLLDEQFSVSLTVAKRYHICVLDFTLSSAAHDDDDGVFEPNEQILINSVRICNTGELALPAGAILEFPSTSTVLIFPGQFVTLPEVKSNERLTITQIFRGRIHDVTSPNRPGPFSASAVVTSIVTLLGRTLDGSQHSQELEVKYPLHLQSVVAPQQMGRGEECLLTINIMNSSHVAYVSDVCPSHCGDLTPGPVTLRIRLDRRLLVTGLKFCSNDLCGQCGGGGGGGGGRGTVVNTQMSRSSGYASVTDTDIVDSPITMHTVGNDSNSPVLASNASLPLLHNHHLYADSNQADSVYVDVDRLLPKNVTHVHLMLHMEDRAELFDKALVQVELHLRDKLIEYEQHEIRVAPYFSGLESNGKALFITGPNTDRSAFLQWQYLLKCAGLPPQQVDLWDTERYGGLSYYHQDDKSRQRHQVTWVNRYHDQLIIYPNYDHRLLSGWDITDHFHGPSTQDHQNNSYKFRHDSAMLLVAPIHRTYSSPSPPPPQSSSSPQTTTTLPTTRESSSTPPAGADSIHKHGGGGASVTSCSTDSQEEFLKEQACLLAVLALIRIPSRKLPRYGGFHLFHPHSGCHTEDVANKRMKELLEWGSSKLSQNACSCVAYNRMNDFVCSYGGFRWNYGSLDVRGLTVARSERLVLMSPPPSPSALDEQLKEFIRTERIPIGSYWAQMFLVILSLLPMPNRSNLMKSNPSKPIFTLPWGEEIFIAQLAALSLQYYLSAEIYPNMNAGWRFSRVCSDMISHPENYKTPWLHTIFLYLLQYRKRLTKIVKSPTKRALVSTAKKLFDNAVQSLTRTLGSPMVTSSLQQARTQESHGAPLHFDHLVNHALVCMPHRFHADDPLLDLSAFLTSSDYENIDCLNNTKEILTSLASFANVESIIAV